MEFVHWSYSINVHSINCFHNRSTNKHLQKSAVKINYFQPETSGKILKEKTGNWEGLRGAGSAQVENGEEISNRGRKSRKVLTCEGDGQRLAVGEKTLIIGYRWRSRRSEPKLESLYDERNLLANNTSPGFTVTRFNLQWTGYCFPHFWLALFNVKNRNVDEWHLYASFLP